MASAIIGAMRAVLGLDTVEFSAGAQRAGAQADALGKKLGDMGRPAARAGADMGRMGGALQNTSFQLQDLVVQLQSGQSATIALSQQLPQLLGGFGALGAVVGLVAGLSVPLIARIDGLSKVGDAAAQSMGRLVAVLPALGGVGSGIVGAMTAVAENLDRIVFYAGAAAAMFAGRYVAGMIAGAVATGGLSAALGVLRGAIMRTGFGLLVVGAGELAYRFAQLIKGAGGFGKAVSLLWDVAKDVFSRIGSAIMTLVNATAAAGAGMAAELSFALADMAQAVNGFLNDVVSGFNTVFKTNLPMDVLDGAFESLNDAGSDALIAAGNFRAAGDAAFEAASKPIASLDALREAVTAGSDAMADAAPVAFGLGKALDDGSAGGGSAGSAAERLRGKVEAAEGALKRMLETLSPAAKEALAFQDAMIEAGMSAEELGKAKADMVISGVDGIANAFGDFVSGGLRDFKSFAGSIIDTFKGMLSQMIAMAAKNRIMLSMGFGGAGMAGPAMAGGAGGPAAGIGSALGGAMGGLGAGFSSAVGGLMSGGLGGAASAIGTALSGATTGLAGMATAIGALALPVGAAIAAFTFFRKKTETLDQGLRFTAKGMDAMVETFEKTKTTRFWGLSKNVDTDYDPAERSVANPLERAYRQTFESVRDMAQTLGVGADAFRGFSHQFKLSLEDMTDDQRRQAIAAEFEKVGNALARTAGVTSLITREGETASQALTRLTSSMAAVNGAWGTFGFSLMDVSIKGAAAASRIVDAFGGIEAFAQGTQFYFQNFYSASEQMQTIGRQLGEQFRDLGVRVMPKTSEQFRDLVDRMQAQGRSAAAAALIALAPVFKQFEELRGQSRETAVRDDGGSVGGPNPANDNIPALYRELWTLQGRTDRLRKMELRGMSAAEAAIQRRIWALEDEQEAEDKARAAVLARRQERDGLMETLYEMQGRTRKMRQLELRSMNPANRALQKRIWMMQDAKVAEEKAADIADEREGIMRRLYEATGNQQALDKLELKGYSKANRALVRHVMGLERAAEAMDAMDPADFVSRFAFDRAKGRAANRNSMPDVKVPRQAEETKAADKTAKAIAELTEQQRQLGISMDRHVQATARVLQKWERDGMPKERFG